MSYPEATPFRTDYISKGPFQVYYEEYGNPNGIPVIFLHGGPGSGIKAKTRKYFDPEKFHFVLFDQRGCGKSTPLYQLEENTTDRLIEDIEDLRQHLGFEKFIICGGSWGSTLSLLYAQKYPEAIQGISIFAIFLATQPEMDWVFCKNGAANFFQEAYEKFIHPVPEEKRSNAYDVAQHYDKLFHHQDEETRHKALHQWLFYQDHFADFWFDGLEDLEETCYSKESFGKSRIIHHYESNGFFIPEGHILENMYKIQHIPLRITHGRYDMLCRPVSAHTLQKAHKKSKLCIAEDSGHIMSEKMTNLFIKQTEELIK